MLAFTILTGADLSFFPQITQKYRLSLLFISDDLPLFSLHILARMKTAMFEVVHDLSARHIILLNAKKGQA
jgi:hypothetical protein